MKKLMWVIIALSLFLVVLISTGGTGEIRYGLEDGSWSHEVKEVHLDMPNSLVYSSLGDAVHLN